MNTHPCTQANDAAQLPAFQEWEARLNTPLPSSKPQHSAQIITMLSKLFFYPFLIRQLSFICWLLLQKPLLHLQHLETTNASLDLHHRSLLTLGAQWWPRIHFHLLYKKRNIYIYIIRVSCRTAIHTCVCARVQERKCSRNGIAPMHSWYSGSCLTVVTWRLSGSRQLHKEPAFLDQYWTVKLFHLVLQKYGESKQENKTFFFFCFFLLFSSSVYPLNYLAVD